MAHAPAVVIIARHGPRLDAADQSWHLSTPTPYDPPLTYGGWNQCRALGTRIASLLHSREQSVNAAREETESSTHAGDGAEDRPRKRRRIKHRVVIHTSPFLRCLQTSIGIAAGMAQYNPTIETASQSRSKTSGSVHSTSPRTRPTESQASPHLIPVSEPKQSLAHEVAKRSFHGHERPRKAKLRVDAFLGEWLNPSYFENITPPPQSAMMVTAAKAELMQSDAVDIFLPNAGASSRVSLGSLWGGGSGKTAQSKDNSLEEWSPVQEALDPPSPRRDRASTYNNAGLNEGGRRSPFRPGASMQPLTSALPKSEALSYHPPVPHYAVSSASEIPRGYVAHARKACTDVDYQWDSSKSPLDWGDGGEYGEEWSAMHKRLRKGLNHLILWYSQHEGDGRDDGLNGTQQAAGHGEDDEEEDEEEEEELVVVLVTHGAGSNALIGALTGQPVLLDVGTASLTLAERRADAPELPTGNPESAVSGRTPTTEVASSSHAQRGILDLGLSSIYELRLVSSSEHLRPSSDSRSSSNSKKEHSLHGRGKTSAALGSIRRPSAALLAAPPSSETSGLGAARSNTMAAGERLPSAAPPFSSGLWTPPASRTPVLQAQQQVKEERTAIFSSLNDTPPRSNSESDSAPNVTGTSPNSQSTRSESLKTTSVPLSRLKDSGTRNPANLDDAADTPSKSKNGTQDNLPPLPQALSRGLSQKGLWGSGPRGDKVKRKLNGKEAPKRRWTEHEG